MTAAAQRKWEEEPIARTSPQNVEREAVVTSISGIAGYLQSHLGQRITAYLSGLTDSKMVGRWAARKSQPRELSCFRLRCAFQATRLLTEAYDDDTARAWFFGANTLLDDRAPAYVLRHGETPEEMSLVVPVARDFAGRAAG